MEFNQFLQITQDKSRKNINKLHLLAKKIWAKKKIDPIDIVNRCLDTWDYLGDQLGTRIIPWINIDETRPITNLIFGSGSFSTGEFQAEQYNLVHSYATKPPMKLSGIITNKSGQHGCNGAKIAKKHDIPLVELDFSDWYHQNIDKNETNPIKATRYWYPSPTEHKQDFQSIKKNFKIRQNEFHKELGEKISQIMEYPIDTVSARGYNFQFCSNIFKFQGNRLPRLNDTHPADLRYVNPNTSEKLYAGWQSGAIQLMIDDKIHFRYRGSLIEVNYMDNMSQINELDEGALLAIGPGINLQEEPYEEFTAKQIQNLMKIMDDNLFCTLEPTGLLLSWGISETPILVDYYTKEGKKIQIKQHAIIVGNKMRSGAHAWGLNLEEDIRELENFIFP
jgi:hypothetical protein